jgi:DNA-binding transcriptional LysR family regulator
MQYSAWARERSNARFASNAFLPRMQTPSDRLPPLDLLASFEAAARHLSFTRAGAERFITQSAMSRQIQQLEQQLGVALFRRHHRRLTLTEPGLKLQAACVELLGRLRQTVSEIRAPARREVLALTTTPGFAALWLIPRLPGFTQSHPGVDVRLDASYELRDLRGEGFDLAIRYGPVRSSEGRRMFPESVLPVCSPKLLKPGRPGLKAPADLRHHTLLQVAASNAGGMPLEWETWLKAVGLAGLEPASTLTYSSYAETITAALAGQGVAMGRRPLVDALLKSGRLKAPFARSAESQRAYFVQVEASAKARPAVRALEAWLLAQAAKESRSLSS